MDKDTAEWLAALVTIFGGVSAVFGGVIGLYQFSKNNRLKRAEWIDKLHSKFYESQKYKGIRLILDHKPQPRYDDLRNAVVSDPSPDPALCEEFVDYLNFFEYIASLYQLGQLKREELLFLFEYHLKDLNEHDFVRAFLARYDFDNVQYLLDHLPSKISRIGI